MKPLSIGEDRVRIAFNPSANGQIDEIKQLSARLINLVYYIQDPAQKEDEGDKSYSMRLSEFRRLKALACTDYEAGAMWAVKTATI